MRDGTVLRADVYRPAGAGPWPVLLARCPYDRRDPGILAVLDPLGAARRGYLVVVQDTRGRYGSDGAWRPLAQEADDGVDTVRWAARLPGASGRVGMFGPSYLANAQWRAAAAGAPELAAIAPAFTWSDPRDGLLFRGGARELGLTSGWALDQGFEELRRRYAGAPDGPRAAWRRLAAAIDAGTGLSTVDDLDLPGLDGSEPAGHAGSVDLPSFHVAGWYDAFLQGTLDDHATMRGAGRPASLVVGPWSHGSQGGHLGDVAFGVAAAANAIDLGRSLRTRLLDWFDGWLRQGAGGPVGPVGPRPAADPAVLLFVMGINRWYPLESWPPPATTTAMYLRVGGLLSTEPPAAGEAPESYRHDPADPVPTHGGALLVSDRYPAGPLDQARVEGRPDVLVYTSAPVTRDLAVIGRVRATIAVTSTAEVADWVVRLCDVGPDGVSRNLTDGILRARVRPGRVGECEVDLWSTAHVFRAGHRVRVQVASSSFPRWDLGTPAARQTVYHDAARASRIRLPVADVVDLTSDVLD